MSVAPRVLVVGSGFTGLSAAAAAARAGAETILASDSLSASAACASARSGGHILRGLATPAATLIERLGRRDAAELFKMTTLAAEALLARPEARRSGSTLCDDADRPDGSADEAAAIRALSGASVERWSAAETAERTGARRVSGAVFDPVGGFVAAEALHRALLAEAVEAGVRLESRRIASLSECGDMADKTVIAAGGGGGALTDGLDAAPTRTTLYICAVDGPVGDTPSVCIEGDAPEYVWARDGELRFGVRGSELLDARDLFGRIERRFGPCAPRLLELRSDMIWKPGRGAPKLALNGDVSGVAGFAGHGVALSCFFGGLLGGAAADVPDAAQALSRAKALFDAVG